MRYRVKAGRAALRRRFEREAAAKPQPPAAPPLPAAACDNPYFRCYGTARRLEDLKKK